MTELQQAAQQALKILDSEFTTLNGEFCRWCDGRLNAKHNCALEQTIAALRAALEQTEQEPVAWIQSNHLQKAQREPFLCRVEPTQRLSDFVPLYTHPPHCDWQGLTEEEIWKLYYDERVPEGERCDRVDFARAIEAALKEKNK